MQFTPRPGLRGLARFFTSCVAILGVFFVFQNCSAPTGLSVVTTASGSTNLGSSGDGTTVGLDYSGTWRLKRLDCYDSSMQKITNTATFSNLSETLTILGNQLKKTISQNSCAVVSNMGIVFQSTYAQISNEVVASASGGNCVVNYLLSNSQILPVTSAITYAATEKVLPDLRGFFYFASKTNGIQELGMISDFYDTKREYCMKIYQKN